MRAKYREFFLLSLLFCLSFALPAAAEPTAETAAETAAAESSGEAAAEMTGTETAVVTEIMETGEPEIIEYEEPQGVVLLDPDFQWREEDPESFVLDYVLRNESTVEIPETEVVFRFPEESGLVFSDGSRELTERITGFSVGAVHRGRAEGQLEEAAEMETAEPEQPQQTGEEQTEAETEFAGELRMTLTLRGYGLEHSTEHVYELPAPEVEEPVELETTVFLVTRLWEQGKLPVDAEYAYAPVTYHELQTDQGEAPGKRILKYLPRMKEQTENEKQRLWILLIPLLAALMTFTVFNEILVKREIRRAETTFRAPRRKDML